MLNPHGFIMCQPCSLQASKPATSVAAYCFLYPILTTLDGARLTPSDSRTASEILMVYISVSRTCRPLIRFYKYVHA